MTHMPLYELARKRPRLFKLYETAKKSRILYRIVKAYRHLTGDMLFRHRLRHSKSLKIVLGAGNFYDPGWIPSEIDFLNLLKEGHWQRHFRPESIDALLAENVWIYLTEEEGLQAARRCYRYLKPGGYLRVAVSDALNPDPRYIHYASLNSPEPSLWYVKVRYNYHTLSSLFEDAGFTVNLLEYWDDSGVFHQNEWDPSSGIIRSSKRSETEQNRIKGRAQSTLMLDAIKPGKANQNN